MPTNWFQSTDRFRDPIGARRIAQFIDILSRFTPGHLVDLGAGHGIFSLVAVELGWRVTAVDARDERFPDDSSISWVVADVRVFDKYDDVDVVACLGLWYHLTLEDQKALASKIAPRPLIIDTHVGTRVLPRYHNQSDNRISELVSDDGFEGRLYNERGLEARATASWGNSTSFWPTVASLEREMYEAGYEVVEQYSPPYLADRGFFLARSLGGNDARERIEGLVTRFNPVTGTAITGTVIPSLHGDVVDFAPVVAKPSATPRAAAAGVAAVPAPGVRASSRQLGAAVVRYVRHQGRRLYRLTRRRSRRSHLLRRPQRRFDANQPIVVGAALVESATIRSSTARAPSTSPSSER
ncbi:MAG: methyltransferase domain-containing protein [Jatrophihabitantaceae bacterium]